MSDGANDPLRRQLRFSLFLQAGACVMFTIAFIVQTLAGGFGSLTIVFGLLAALCGGAFVFTRSKLSGLG
ncbi:MAG: hypothetical protein FJW80_00115 [Actinobacteria bacterium]|nr:hypothetical protein [Actinomycetota bacterium]